MVKFGRHLQFFLDNEHQGSNLFVVPYNDIRELTGADAALFLDGWNSSLERATMDFDRAMTQWWQMIFQGISHLEESRGALPEVALRLYASIAEEEELQEVLSLTKQIHSTALTNAEALRKLVKKFDKEHAASDDGAIERLSPMLLPKVYASNFTAGQSTLEAALIVLRTQLHMDDEDVDAAEIQELGSLQQEDDVCLTCETTPASYLTARRHSSKHDEAVQLRKSELEWLKMLLKSIPPSEISHIVAHRGFHNVKDRSDRRPLENSQSAYETAWTHGIHLCECDVALTKDEKLVLAHDEDFSRLALDSSDPNSTVKVRDLTFRQLLSLPLKSGIRPPLLVDVLRSACEIGDNSQLIIEIKPGNSDAATALARMFLKYPRLMSACAVVMSFDAFAMHNLRREMLSVLDALQNNENPNTLSKTTSIPTSMSFGNFSVAENLFEFTSPSSPRAIHRDESPKMHRNTDSSGSVGMWLSESVNRNDSFQMLAPFAPHGNFIPPPPHLPPPHPSPSNGGLHKRLPSVDRYLSTSPNLRRRPSIDRSRGSLISHFGAPKLMLLTVADPPKITCELCVDVDDLSPVDGWLSSHDGSLDGVYLQFQKKMMTIEGAKSLRAMSEKYAVGVWGHNGRDPDDWDTFHWLVKQGGVSYVNTDLPKGFKKVFRNAVSELA